MITVEKKSVSQNFKRRAAAELKFKPCGCICNRGERHSHRNDDPIC